MRAVINLETAFALLMLLYVISRFIANPISHDSLPDNENAGNAQRRSWLLLLLVIPAAFLWTFTIPLVSDDFVSIAAALRFTPDKIAGLFTIPESNHFFRPLGYLSLALDARCAGHSLTLWHLSALLIHFPNCILLSLVARRIGLTRWLAALAP